MNHTADIKRVKSYKFFFITAFVIFVFDAASAIFLEPSIRHLIWLAPAIAITVSEIFALYIVYKIQRIHLLIFSLAALLLPLYFFALHLHFNGIFLLNTNSNEKIFYFDKLNILMFVSLSVIFYTIRTNFSKYFCLILLLLAAFSYLDVFQINQYFNLSLFIVIFVAKIHLVHLNRYFNGDKS